MPLIGRAHLRLILEHFSLIISEALVAPAGVCTLKNRQIALDLLAKNSDSADNSFHNFGSCVLFWLEEMDATSACRPTPINVLVNKFRQKAPLPFTLQPSMYFYLMTTGLVNNWKRFPLQWPTGLVTDSRSFILEHKSFAYFCFYFLWLKLK